jgi:hypothetical protein
MVRTFCQAKLDDSMQRAASLQWPGLKMAEDQDNNKWGSGFIG